MSKAFRSACVFVFVSAGAVLSVPGCSQQGQGERCDIVNGDADCNSGLKCVEDGKLAVQGTPRCCPDPGTETDSRCQRLGGSETTGGSGGAAAGSSGSSNGGSSAGSSSGGMSSLPEAGAAGASDSTPGGSSNSSAGAPAMTAGAANAGAGGAP